VRCFGDEVRPVPLEVSVRAYPATMTDFLFEKSLDAHLPAVLASHSDGRPSLIFCASRKGAEATARALATGSTAAARRASLPPPSRATLDATASRVADRGLADCLRAGVGVHHAGLDNGDRGAVETLFSARHLPALCTTSTLATGVNLPAYLVVVKGTRRWASDGGGAPGFKDYGAADVLQMLGRAGRPQHDTRGVGVVMTRAGPGAARLAALAAGAEPVVSRLAASLGDHLNAEIVLRTVTDVETAVAWMKRTFLWARVRADPAAHGFPAGADGGALERLAAQRYVAASIDALVAAGLARAEAGGTGLSPLPPCEAAARHYVRLASVALVRALPPHASLPDVLAAVCGAAEFEGTTLRRGEKKPLNALNRAAAGAGLPTVAGGGSKARVATPADKLFVLAVDACGPSPSTGLDFSMRREADTLLRTGARIASCARAVLRAAGAFAGAANAARLERTLSVGALDGTDAEVRQLRGVGGALGARLAAAGLGRLAALRASDARTVELAAGRAYPFGADLLAAAAALAPPGLEVKVAGAAWRAGGRLDARVTLTRTTAPPPRPGGRPHYGLLIVGTPSDDALLAAERVALDTFASPLVLTVSTRARAPIALVAALLPERVVGADVTADSKLGGGEVFKVGGEGEVGAVEQGAAVEASPGPEPCARWHSPAPRAKRQTTLFGRFKYVPPPGEAAEVEEAAGAAAAADPLPPPRDLSPAASTAPPSAPPPAPTPMPPPPPAASKEGGDEYADVFSFL
jgi:ATP-dependent DNA helicase HFM1/MER3